MRKIFYFGLMLFLTFLLQGCSQSPANSERAETQLNPETQAANIKPISNELRPWNSANYRGLEVGKSTDKDTLLVLGKPISIIDTPLNNTAKGFYYGGADSLIVRIDRKSNIISWIETNPKNIPKADIIKEFGNNYMLIVYGHDPCFIEGKSSPPFVSSIEKTINTTNTQSVVMEYRDLGLSIRFRGENEKFMYDNEVYQINYFSDKWPIGTTSSLCDQPQKGLSFIACGCGCCGGAKPMKQCIYRSKGDDIMNLVEDDKKWSGSDCNTVGCSNGTKYVYCD